MSHRSHSTFRRSIMSVSLCFISLHPLVNSLPASLCVLLQLPHFILNSKLHVGTFWLIKSDVHLTLKTSSCSGRQSLTLLRSDRAGLSEQLVEPRPVPSAWPWLHSHPLRPPISIFCCFTPNQAFIATQYSYIVFPQDSCKKTMYNLLYRRASWLSTRENLAEP